MISQNSDKISFIVIYTMAPKSSNSKTYKDGIKLGLERLKQMNYKQ